MGIRKYPLPGGDGDGSKVVYPLGLGMEMEMNFYYGNEDGIMIPVPTPPRCHPYVQPHRNSFLENAFPDKRGSGKNFRNYLL